ncbi:MAG: hypothetical protein CFE21_01160 [Bacteroidetes bacterium B1(2017)]|nr:MAG: hypothetical protein CFE21_01160 [Bacteroidetes bacterium B1(2017)]
MKKLFGLFCLSVLLYSCQCDEIKIKSAYLQFYFNGHELDKHPIDSNTLMRVYTYYPNASWDQNQFIDSNKLISLNWYSVRHINDSIEMFMELDQRITPNNKANELGSYNYWLKSVKGDLQIKISNVKIKVTPKSGRCSAEQSEFETCTINDSLHTFSEPIKLW